MVPNTGISSGGRTTVALNLFSHLSNSVVAAPLLKFIHHDQVGKIKHLNLF
jgi:molybdopterin-guanine dinucleotide biosynthesis protein